MLKLYDNDTYSKNFTAEIIEITQKDHYFHIALDQTAFYPGREGHPCDIGFIEDSPITQVYEENGQIYHVSPKKPIKIHKVNCTLDWAHRLDYMQQHTAQHLLSACLLNSYAAKTTNFQFGQAECTLEVHKQLSASQLLEIQTLVNELIGEGIQTEVLYPTKQVLKKLPLTHALPKGTAPIRIVKLGDIDCQACSGLHLHNTLEVQMLKILKSEKYKEGLRITFIAGNRAIKNALEKDLFVTTLCQLLKSSQEELLEKIKTSTEVLQQTTAENRKLKSIVADYEINSLLESAPQLGNIRVIKVLYTDKSLKDVQLLGSKLTAAPHTIALLGVISQDHLAHLIFMCSKEVKKISMHTLLQDSITLIDGRGGGSTLVAQGGGKASSNLSSALDYAYMKIKSSLS